MNDAFGDVVCESSFLARRKPLKGVDVIVIVINYLEFKSIDLDIVSKLVKCRTIVEGRRVVELYRAIKHGFKCYGISCNKVFELRVREVEFVFIHSSQHYDHEMSRIFLDELELPKPHESLMFKNGNSATRVGEMIIELERALGSYWSRKSRIMLIQRNTNIMLAAGLTALI